MNNADAFARLTDLFADPMVVVSVSGEIQLVNRAASAKLYLEHSTRPANIVHCANEARDEVLSYLKLCARTSERLPGVLTLRKRPDLEFARFQCAGAALTDDDGRRLVLLHLVPREVSLGGFVALNRRIDQLSREISLRLMSEKTVEEQREVLRVTLASIGDAVITTDNDGRIAFMNGAAEVSTGWKQEECIGRLLEDIFQIRNEDTGKPVENPVLRVRARGTVVGLANHTILIRKDGGQVPIDDTAAPIRDRDGHMIGVVLVFHDVGDRRRLERELRQQTHALKEADARKDEFLAMLGHELRNPLATLRNCVHMLLSDPTRVRDPMSLAQMMSRQTHQLTRLVDDLLDISRITRGLVRLDKHPIHLNSVIEHAVETVMPLVLERQHELVVQMPAERLTVDADLTRLSQAVCNLLTNAAKFTNTGGKITVDGWGKSGRAFVRVRDTGIGIRAELLPYIFDLFRQADRSLDRSQGGLGIGLTVAQNLVQMHGGNIEARSEGPGRGAEFILSLPLSVGLVTDTVVTAPATHRLEQKVLIIDDNVDAAQSLAMVVGSWDCKVEIMADGQAALVHASEYPPDVVLLDIGLPGMDGYEVAQRLRQQTRTAACTIIAISGYGAEGDRRRAHDAGFDHHLTKPVDIAQLRELLTTPRHGRP
jgi:PAS domain S-box-containing protein